METTCPYGHRVEISSSQVGTEVRCPTCQTAFTATSGPNSGTTAGTTPGTGTGSGGGAGSATAVGAAAGAAAGSSRSTSSPNIRAAEATRYHPTTAGDYWADRYNMDVLERLRPFGQILLLAGLVLALLARGWDTVGDRHAAAANLRVQKEITEFEDDYQDELDDLRQEEADLQNREDFDNSDRDRLAEIRQEIRDLQRQQAREQDRQRDRWDDLRRSARETQAENQLAKPWREGLFVFGTILFSLGLLGIGFTTEGPVRWFCLVLLAIIVFGLFFGDGWTSSAFASQSSSSF